MPFEPKIPELGVWVIDTVEDMGDDDQVQSWAADIKHAETGEILYTAYGESAEDVAIRAELLCLLPGMIEGVLHIINDAFIRRGAYIHADRHAMNLFMLAVEKLQQLLPPEEKAT